MLFLNYQHLSIKEMNKSLMNIAYHPDTRLSDYIAWAEMLLPHFDDAYDILMEWCRELSVYHQVASIYFPQTWSDLLAVLSRELNVKQDNDTWRKMFPCGGNSKLNRKKASRTKQRESLRALLQLMTSTIAPMLQRQYHDNEYSFEDLRRTMINLYAHQLIHDLLVIFPEYQSGNWKTSLCPSSSSSSEPISRFPRDQRTSLLFDLPCEILDMIFDYQSLQTVLGLRQVCKTWKDHLVPKIAVEYFPHQSTNAVNRLSRLIEIFPRMNKANLFYLSDPATHHKVLHKIITSPTTMTGLKQLRLEGYVF